MALSKQKKGEVLDKLREAAKGAESVAFVKFNKLTVADATKMRRALREKNIRYFVAKKTLIRKAFSEKNYGGEWPALEGEIAIAWGADALAPAREVYCFEKSLPENVKLVGGIFDGAFASEVAMQEIATIPTLPVLYSKLLYLFMSPITRTVIALDAIGKKKEVNQTQ